jgi:serine/threonine-protein kinase
MQAEDVTKVIDREPEAPVEDVSSEEESVSEAKPAEVETGRVLHGRYELIHRLGHGGMASVYLGRAIGTAGFERLVAVKVIHPHLANESEFVEMFLDEARIAAKIHHPNVCETLDLGDDDGVFFMVMEYVEGETLSSLVRQLLKREEKLPITVALQIAADACRGLEAAHSLEDHDGTALNLVHRDVSPHNLLVTMDGRVKVVDFGIMKAAGKRSNTLTGQLRGKLTYMSPEQARGEPVDRRSDIYAMGVILWELLAGARFYRGETDSEILAQVSLGRRQNIGDYREDVPESVQELLEKALAESRYDRFETAEEMLKGLRAALRHLLDADEDDPREVLGGVMTRFFGTRIKYIQAAIRGQVDDREGSSRNRVRAANDQTSVIASRGLTPSQVEVGRTGTFTQSVATAPARSWALWLILPLAGAALGTLAVRAGFDSDPATTPRASTQSVAPKPAEVKPDLVKWVFNTDPQGATVIVGGKALEQTTPTSVQLPRSDETVVVKISLPGYKSREVEMAPLGPENHNVRLEPEYKTTFSARTPDPTPKPEVSPTKTSSRPKKWNRPKKKPGKVEQPPVAEPAPKGDDREPEDVPDFLKKKKKKTP